MFKQKKFWIGLVISLICLYFSFKDIKINEVILALQKINYWYLIPALLSIVVILVTRSYRWKLMIKNHSAFKFYDIWVANVIGFLGLFTLPARIGEFVRAFLLGKKANVKKTMILSTILVERITDGVGALLLFILALWLYPFKTTNIGYNVKNIIGIGVGIYFAGMFVLLLIQIFSTQSKKISYYLINFLPERYKNRLSVMIESFFEGLSALGSIWKFFLLIFYSIIMWVIMALPNYFLILGFNIPFNFWHALIINGFLALAVTIPAAPGFIGTFHIAVQIVLALYKIDDAVALSYAWILWLVNFSVFFALGLYYLNKEKLNLLNIENE
jgi:glycosyltransferase 2 family protein